MFMHCKDLKMDQPGNRGFRLRRWKRPSMDFFSNPLEAVSGIRVPEPVTDGALRQRKRYLCRCRP